jgi:hypothetical protein
MLDNFTVTYFMVARANAREFTFGMKALQRVSCRTRDGDKEGGNGRKIQRSESTTRLLAVSLNRGQWVVVEFMHLLFEWEISDPTRFAKNSFDFRFPTKGFPASSRRGLDHSRSTGRIDRRIDVG